MIAVWTRNLFLVLFVLIPVMDIKQNLSQKHLFPNICAEFLGFIQCNNLLHFIKEPCRLFICLVAQMTKRCRTIGKRRAEIRIRRTDPDKQLKRKNSRDAVIPYAIIKQNPMKINIIKN